MKAATSIIGAAVARDLCRALLENGWGRTSAGQLAAVLHKTRGGNYRLSLSTSMDCYGHGNYKSYDRLHYIRCRDVKASINRLATAAWLNAKRSDDKDLRLLREAVYELAESREIDPETLPEGHSSDYTDMSQEDCEFWTEYLNTLPKKAATV